MAPVWTNHYRLLGGAHHDCGLPRRPLWILAEPLELEKAYVAGWDEARAKHLQQLEAQRRRVSDRES